jgi:hypothetical protein
MNELKMKNPNGIPRIHGRMRRTVVEAEPCRGTSLQYRNLIGRATIAVS